MTNKTKMNAIIDNLMGRLQIDLTKPAKAMSKRILNEKAPKDAEITNVAFELDIFSGGKFRSLNAKELATVVYDADSITILGQAEIPVEHKAPNGKHFTVADLAAAIEETERQTRGATEWFGGIDVHHVYFERIFRQKDGSWKIFWGS